MKSRSQTKEWPLEVKSGSAVVKIYRTEKKDGYVSFAAIYYKGSERKTRFFMDLVEAKTEAKKIADEISQGEHISLDLSMSQRLAVARALEILSPLNIPIDVVASHYAEAYRQIAPVGGNLMDAVRYYAKHHGGITKKTIPTAVDVTRFSALVTATNRLSAS